MGFGERIDFAKVFRNNPPPDAYIRPLINEKVDYLRPKKKFFG